MPASAAISRSEAPLARPGAGLQRTRGSGRIAFKRFNAATTLSTLYQEGAAKIRLPRQHGPAPCGEAVLINTAGGLTGGDRLDWQVAGGAGTRTVATTQACEKVYRSAGGAAEVHVRLDVGSGARLDWLPQETILFDRSRLARSIEADLAPDARLLIVEAVIFGREAMGETVKEGSFRDRWRIRRAGRLVHAEEIRLEGGIHGMLQRPAVLAGARAMASLVYLGDDAGALLEGARDTVGEAGGASAFGGKLVARLAATDGISLRRPLAALIAALRGGTLLPRVWTT